MTAFMDGMALDEHGRYHGDANCPYQAVTGDWDFPEMLACWFRCSGCKRKICYCGGHDGAGTDTCRRNCSKCDDCCMEENE